MVNIVSPDFSDKKSLEKYSSAFTLSDMEVFIFPELFYPLLLANIMSPVIWRWRDDPWFNDISTRSFLNKANRIKQYIIDNYIFNLDLETWGLTMKEKEIERFSAFFDTGMLKQSNALFGYEGDKYYFSIDIRRHFGLDKYNNSVIPYWKTETVEAMNAFTHKEHYNSGAGECVSLAALYAAALFIVGGIPLEKIFIIATPLHSQNFINEREGILTNNRRIVTKNMWFNGTSLSAKARRALENERITIVSHITGHIHTVYNEASIDQGAYHSFREKLGSFVRSNLTPAILINFLRFKTVYKCLFQYRHSRTGSDHYMPLEKLFEYEHTSKAGMNAETRGKLLSEVDFEEFAHDPLPGKIILNDVEEYLKMNGSSDINSIEEEFISLFNNEHTECVREMFRDLKEFLITEPRFPSSEKEFIRADYPVISVSDSREKIITTIIDKASVSEMARLSLYVYRDMSLAEWEPFVKAAIERNPVSHESLGGRDAAEIFTILDGLNNESIYDSVRMAQPDEVWNFSRGDGAEKAFLMANALIFNDPDADVVITLTGDQAEVGYRGERYSFKTSKGYEKEIVISRGGYEEH